MLCHSLDIGVEDVIGWVYAVCGVGVTGVMCFLLVDAVHVLCAVSQSQHAPQLQPQPQQESIFHITTTMSLSCHNTFCIFKRFVNFFYFGNSHPYENVQVNLQVLNL